MTLKKSLFAALVAVGAVAVMSESSHAFFGWRGGHGSCGSSGGGWGSRGSWGGSHGGWGSRGSHGSWGGGSYGSYGGGSHGSYGGGYATSYWGYGYARSEAVPREVIASKPAVKTRLTLNVPAEAKVTLAGVDTKQTGEVRQFSTTNLKSGQVWDDYKVVVEMEQDGQMLREERIIKLTGGQAQELSISFDSTQLAQR